MEVQGIAKAAFAGRPHGIAHFRVIALERPDGAGMLLADLAFFAGFDRDLAPWACKALASYG